jgi:hypothetical protein
MKIHEITDVRLDESDDHEMRALQRVAMESRWRECTSEIAHHEHLVRAYSCKIHSDGEDHLFVITKSDDGEVKMIHSENDTDFMLVTSEVTDGGPLSTLVTILDVREQVNRFVDMRSGKR